MNKCIFLDRDGVLNKERGDYTWKVEDFEIEEGVIEALQKLKKQDYWLIIITNQGGINKGIYTKDDVYKCHEYLQKECGNLIDDIFYSPYHDNFTKSLSRKPNSIMLERAIYKYNVDITQSWMIGDSERDLIAGENVGLLTAYISKNIGHEKTRPLYKSLVEFTNKYF